MKRAIVTFALIVWTAGAPARGGVMLGAHVGERADSAGSEAEFSAFEASIGRKLAIDNDIEGWGAFPDARRVEWDAQNGRLSMLSWRIVFQTADPKAGCATAEAITTGKYDAQLQRQAAQVKALGRPILVRFNWEMTNNPENTCFTGFRVKQNIPVAGAKYIDAWRHVVDKFRAAGATNVKWAWVPGSPAFLTDDWRAFYPGANYVDWIGIDIYNKTDTPMSFATAPAILAFYAAAAALGKPLVIAETGAVNDARLDPDAQTEWLTTMRAFLKSRPAIKAVLYWNNTGVYARENPGYGGSGYVLRGAGLAAFRAMAIDPYFN